MPDWKPHIRGRLAAKDLDAAREIEVAEEWAQHLQDRYEELIARGAADEDAVQTALLELTELQKAPFGARKSRRSDVRFENLLRDFRAAFRSLSKNPGFALAAVLTLALGIGANSVMFSVARAVLFRPLGFEGEDRLVWLERVNTRTGARESQFSWRDVEDIRAAAKSFESIALDGSHDMPWEDGTSSKQVSTVCAMPSLLEILRIGPALGRTLAETDSSELTVMISHDLWQSRFGGSTGVIGQTVRLDQKARTIVGVLPPNLEFPIIRTPQTGNGSIVRAGRMPFWLPMPKPQGDDGTSRGARMFLAVARLKPTVSEETARAELRAISEQLGRQHPDTNKNWDFSLVSFRDQVLGHNAKGIPVLFGAVLAVLLICCVNLANLLLARGIARHREFSVRIALGAGRSQLISAVITEAIAISLLGGLAGLALAQATLEGLAKFAAASVPFINEAHIGFWEIVFTSGISIGTALLFGLLPAVRLSRSNAAEALRSGGRSSGGPEIRVWQQSLLVGQIALALALLAAAGLLLESFRRLVGQDLGYQPRSVVVMDLATIDFPTNGDVCRMYRTLRERLKQVPGVAAVGTISSAPLTGKWTFSERPDIVGHSVPLEDRPPMAATFVAFDYFQAMAIPLLEGRFFRDDELNDDGYGKIVILNEAAARLFPGKSAVGSRFTVGSNPDRVLEVIGVVKDTRDVRLEENPQPRFYWQYTFGGAQVLVRVKSAPEAALPMLREVVRSTDARVRLHSIQTMSQIVSSTVSERRFLMIMISAYAGLALTIAAIGIFAVIAYQAGQRGKEFGIRLALGSTPRLLTRLVLIQAGRLAVMGVGMGLAISLGTNQLLASQLFGLNPHDPFLLAVAGMLILAVALAAALFPARAAAKVDPMITLRAE